MKYLYLSNLERDQLRKSTIFEIYLYWALYMLVLKH